MLHLRKRKSSSGEYVYKERLYTETLPNIDFLESHGITTKLHPVDEYNVFLPSKRKEQGGEEFLLVDIATFTFF